MYVAYPRCTRALLCYALCSLRLLELSWSLLARPKAILPKRTPSNTFAWLCTMHARKIFRNDAYNMHLVDFCIADQPHHQRRLASSIYHWRALERAYLMCIVCAMRQCLSRNHGSLIFCAMASFNMVLCFEFSILQHHVQNLKIHVDL